MLGDENAVLGIIKDELAEIRRLDNDKRRTDIVPDEGEIDVEDLIAEEDMASPSPRPATSSACRSRRTASRSAAARASQGVNLKDEDVVEHLFITSTHDYVLFFTSKGKVYRMKVHELPVARRNAGQAHRQPVAVEQNEKICAVINTRNFDVSDGKYLMFGTRNGIVKKTVFASYDRSRPTASSPSTCATTTSSWPCATPRATTTS